MAIDTYIILPRRETHLFRSEPMTVETRTEESGASSAPLRDPLATAKVLVEIGELDEAEAEVVRILAESNDEHDARGLLGRIKHMKGELTQAFTCWAQVRAQRPESGGAQMRLNTMMQLAQDPERGAGEFLALGRTHLWRKPVQMLELEHVFQLFVRRQPEEARAACELLASKYSSSDPQLYKLAVLGQAWIAELSGDLDLARRILEDLGRERGFEEDVDRALALTRIYPQLRGAENLRKAVHVCEFLARTLRSFQQVCALGTLAALHRELGDLEEAARWDAEFLAAFQIKMYRVSLAEAIAVAARRYVPLDKLASMRFTHRRSPRQEASAGSAGRRRGLALALTGEPARAAEQFRRGGELLDLQYLADLTAIGGDGKAAVGLLLQALEREPGDARTIGRLLLEFDEHGDSGIREVFTQPAMGNRARDVLERLVREMPLRPVLWRQLAALHRISEDDDDAARCTARAQALAAADARRDRVVGRALSAAVYHFAGDAQGLIHEVWAERQPAAAGRGGHLTELLGSVKPELEQAVRNILVSVREYAQAKLPHQTDGLTDYNYSFKITKEDEPSSGVSAGLPIALAFLSVFLGRPLRQDIASSGAVVADAHDVVMVQAVGEVEHKVRGAYNRSLRMLILPEGNRGALEASLIIPRAVSDELVRYVSSLDEAVTLAFGPDIWVS